MNKLKTLVNKLENADVLERETKEYKEKLRKEFWNEVDSMKKVNQYTAEVTRVLSLSI